jgi:hypothetical protein
MNDNTAYIVVRGTSLRVHPLASLHAGAWADPGTNVLLLPALYHAPIVDLTVWNVPAECTAITRWVGHDPRIRIVDHELTAEHQSRSASFASLATAAGATTKLLNTTKGMTTFMAHLPETRVNDDDFLMRMSELACETVHIAISIVAPQAETARLRIPLLRQEETVVRDAGQRVSLANRRYGYRRIAAQVRRDSLVASRWNLRRCASTLCRPAS